MSDTRYDQVLEALNSALAFLRGHGGTFWVPILLGLIRDLRKSAAGERPALYGKIRKALFQTSGGLAELVFEDLVDGRLVLNRQRTSEFKRLMKAIDKALAPDY